MDILKLAKQVIDILKSDPASAAQLLKNSEPKKHYSDIKFAEAKQALERFESAKPDLEKLAGGKKKNLDELERRHKRLTKDVEMIGEVVKRRSNNSEPPRIYVGTNTKLKEDGIAKFGTMAVHTCPGAGSCKSICYADSGMYLTPGARNNQINNWAASERDDFVPRMVAEIQNNKDSRKAPHIRVHDAGDFYSEEYVDKWHQIASALPDKKFYAYTKSLHLNNLDKLRSLPNFHLIQSQGGLFDDAIDHSKAHAVIFPSLDKLTDAGYANASESDLPAAQGSDKVGLVIHGQREGQYKEDRFVKPPKPTKLAASEKSTDTLKKSLHHQLRERLAFRGHIRSNGWEPADHHNDAIYHPYHGEIAMDFGPNGLVLRHNDKEIGRPGSIDEARKMAHGYMQTIGMPQMSKSEQYFKRKLKKSS